MQDEVVLGQGENEEEAKWNTGIRYDKKGPRYGMLTQDIYSTQDLAEILSLHPTTVLQHIEKGSLKAKAFKGPAGYRILKEDVLDWLKSL